MSPHKMPSIMYGTAWKKGQTKSLVVHAVLQGFRGIDTACQPKHYREDLVGEALTELYEQHGVSREDLFIQTKYTPIGSQDQSQPIPYDPSTSIPTQIRDSFARSLKNLRTTWIDSYLLHSPLDTPSRTKEAWSILCELKQEGIIRQIGISNTYDVETLRLLEATGKVDVVQNRWYEGNQWDYDVHKYCRDHGIHYESFWTLTGSPSLYHHPIVTGIAKTKQCTNAQVLYKFAQSLGIIPLAGSTNEQHMKDGVEAEKLELGAELDKVCPPVLLKFTPRYKP